MLCMVPTCSERHQDMELFAGNADIKYFNLYIK
jgi:hypothetical protein